MKIQNCFAQSAFSFVGEIRSMSAQNKKIAILAIAAISLVAACYFAISYVFSRSKVSPSNPNDQKIPLESVNSPRNHKEESSDKLEESPLEQSPLEQSPQLKMDKSPDLRNIVQKAGLLSPQIKEDEVPPMEPQKQTVTNWDEFEAHARPIMQEPGHEMEIPGIGIVSKRVIQTLLNHRQDIQWNDLGRRSHICCSNGDFEVHGCVREALLFDSKIFEDLSKKANLIDIKMETLQQLVEWHYGERPGHLKETYEADQIQAVIGLYKLASDYRDDQLRSSCNTYFQRSMRISGNHILDVYHAVQERPNSVMIFLNQAFLEWKNNRKIRPVIEEHLKKILDDLRSDHEAYCKFVSEFLKQIKWREDDSEMIGLHATLFRNLSVQEIEELTRIILKHAHQPLELLQFLAKHIYMSWKDAEKKIAVILTVCLETATPGADLQKVLDAPQLDKDFLLGLSNDQLRILITQWRRVLNKNDRIEKLKHLFATRSDFGSMIEACIDQDIDFDKFILEMDKSSSRTNCCKEYVLHILKSKDPETIKKLKIANAMRVLNSLGGGDYYPFGAFLAENCPTDCLKFMITELPNMCNIPQSIGEGLFKTLLNDNADPVRIQTAFEAFWQCSDKYRTFEPGLDKELLPEIKTETQLEAICGAIGPSGADREKIVQFLRGEHPHNDMGYRKIFKLNLPQDVIDRIVVD